MKLSDWAVVYLLGALVTLGYYFVLMMTVPDRTGRRRAARVALLSPVWPVAWVWGLAVIVPTLWRMAEWGKK